MTVPDGRRELHFDVFGRPMAAVRDARGWSLFHLGADGKRRRADAVIPPWLDDGEIADWLADLFHEAATPLRGDVVRLR
jgi:hypothetical protein